jgi:hypothetical protein
MLFQVRTRICYILSCISFYLDMEPPCLMRRLLFCFCPHVSIGIIRHMTGRVNRARNLILFSNFFSRVQQSMATLARSTSQTLRAAVRRAHCVLPAARTARTASYSLLARSASKDSAPLVSNSPTILGRFNRSVKLREFVE